MMKNDQLADIEGANLILLGEPHGFGIQIMKNLLSAIVLQ